MRALIISTSQEQSPFPVAPLGALYIAAAARQAGHEVDLLDMMFLRSPRKALLSKIQSSEYEAIGFSIRNLDNCLYASPKSYYLQVERAVREVQEKTNKPIILGGSGFSVAPAGWMKRLKVPFGVIGEGERAFVLLLERLEKGQCPYDIPGVLYADKLNGLLQAAPARISTFLSPAHEYCNYLRYVARGGFISVQSKRGCPFKCIYCDYPALEGSSYRFRDINQLIEEINGLSRLYKKSPLFFTDSVFNNPPEHAKELCRALIRGGTSPQWMACCNPVGFDEELAKLMASAGCVGIEFTLDTLTEKMLALMKKPFTQSDIRGSLNAAAKADLSFAVHLLFGGPGEEAKDIHEGVRFLDSCAKPSAVFASVGIRIYPKTEMERIASDEGLISENDDLFWPKFYLSTALKQPLRILDHIASTRPQWSTPTDWTGWTMRIVQKIVNRVGTRPQWRDVENYGRYMRR